MVAQEMKKEEAEEYRLQQLELRKKEAEEQQRRVKEKYRKRMEEERRKKEAAEALIASRTRWYDDGSSYEGDFLEDEFYENRIEDFLEDQDPDLMFIDNVTNQQEYQLQTEECSFAQIEYMG